jgi:spore cortex biosynthesis protein YabQ
VLTQGVAFAVLALTGCAAGLSFDLYRALRGAFPPGRWLGHVLDAAYGLGATLLVATGLLAAAWGEIRLYTLLALGTGGAAYFSLASPTVRPLSLRLARAVARLLHATTRLLQRSVRALVHPLRRAGRWAHHRVQRRGGAPSGQGGHAAPPEAAPAATARRDGRPPRPVRR